MLKGVLNYSIIKIMHDIKNLSNKFLLCQHCNVNDLVPVLAIKFPTTQIKLISVGMPPSLKRNVFGGNTF